MKPDRDNERHYMSPEAIASSSGIPLADVLAAMTSEALRNYKIGTGATATLCAFVTDVETWLAARGGKLSPAAPAMADRDPKPANMPRPIARPTPRAPAIDPAYASTAAQLGLDPAEMLAAAVQLRARRSGAVQPDDDAPPRSEADVLAYTAAQLEVDPAELAANLARYRAERVGMTPHENIGRQLGVDPKEIAATAERLSRARAPIATGDAARLAREAVARQLGLDPAQLEANAAVRR